MTAQAQQAVAKTSSPIRWAGRVFFGASIALALAAGADAVLGDGLAGIWRVPTGFSLTLVGIALLNLDAIPAGSRASYAWQFTIGAGLLTLGADLALWAAGLSSGGDGILSAAFLLATALLFVRASILSRRQLS
jgi:hypothetical protein